MSTFDQRKTNTKSGKNNVAWLDRFIFKNVEGRAEKKPRTA